MRGLLRSVDGEGGSEQNSLLRGLTLELTGPLRQAILARAEKMYRVPQPGPRWPAVAGPVERIRRDFPYPLTVSMHQG